MSAPADPIILPKKRVQEIPKLDGFDNAKEHFMSFLRENGLEEYHGIFVNPKAAQHFQEIFPEVVKSRNITLLNDGRGVPGSATATGAEQQQQPTARSHFELWSPNANTITIELATDADNKSSAKNVEHRDFVAIGGPSTVVATVLYLMRQEAQQKQAAASAKYNGASAPRVQGTTAASKKNVLYGVTNRFDSNHDGSCYYVHERDCFAVYASPSNRGLFVLQNEILRRIKHFTRPEAFYQEVLDDRDYLKFNIIVRETTVSDVVKIYTPNLYYTYRDVLLSWVGHPEYAHLAQTARHSEKKNIVIDLIEGKLGKHSIFIPDSDAHKALHISFLERDELEHHFQWLSGFLPLPRHDLVPSQVDSQGRRIYGDDVKAIMRFPRDGIVSPWAFENMYKAIREMGGQVQQGMRVKKITLAPHGEDQLRIKSITYEDMDSQEDRVIETEQFAFSFGPSAQMRYKAPEYGLFSHLTDAIQGKKGPAYKPTLKSWYRHLLNTIEEPFGGDDPLRRYMWASGSSSVCMIGIDKKKVDESQINAFRHFIGGENQHWTPIAERIVEDKKGNQFVFFAMQMTGGGNFPTRYITADMILNLMVSTEKMFDLKNKKDVITYDLVQTRGCGRAVSAKNAIAFAPLAKGVIGSYALGGIGMTTSYCNGELMNEMLELLDLVAQGKMTWEQFDEAISGRHMTSPQVEQLYGMKEVLSGVNYAPFTDDPLRTARKLGVNESLSNYEIAAHISLALLLVAAILVRRAFTSSSKSSSDKAEVATPSQASSSGSPLSQQQTRSYGRVSSALSMPLSWRSRSLPVAHNMPVLKAVRMPVATSLVRQSVLKFGQACSGLLRKI